MSMKATTVHTTTVTTVIFADFAYVPTYGLDGRLYFLTEFPYAVRRAKVVGQINDDLVIQVMTKKISWCGFGKPKREVVRFVGDGLDWLTDNPDPKWKQIHSGMLTLLVDTATRYWRRKRATS